MKQFFKELFNDYRPLWVILVIDLILLLVAIVFFGATLKT